MRTPELALEGEAYTLKEETSEMRLRVMVMSVHPMYPIPYPLPSARTALDWMVTPRLSAARIPWAGFEPSPTM